MSGASPFPPIYSAGPLTWSTPLFIAPTALLALIAVLGFARGVSTPARTASPRQLTPLSKLLLAMSVAVMLTFMVDAGVFAARALLDKHWTSTVLAYYIGVSWVAWLLGLICMTNETRKFGRWSWVQYIFWLGAALGESLVAWLWVVALWRPQTGSEFVKYDFMFLGTFVMRYGLEVGTMVLCVIQMFVRDPPAEWTRPLISPAEAATSSYGSTETFRAGQQPTAHRSLLAEFGALMSFSWPRRALGLQLLLVICFLLMLAGVAVSAMTPLAIGRLVDSLGNNTWSFVCMLVLVYVGLRFLRGKSGLIHSAQTWLWLPIGQHIAKTMSMDALERLHDDCSLAFNPARKSDALRAIDQSIPAIVPLFPQLMFQLVPAVADIIVAVALLWFLYSPSAGLIVLITASLYLLLTVSLSDTDRPHPRNEARTRAVNSLLHYETVKYNNAESLEMDRYASALLAWQKADWRFGTSRILTRLAQHTVVAGGLLAGCLLFAWESAQDRCTPGDFVLFTFYMIGLCEPLSAFGAQYQAMQTNWPQVDKVLALVKENHPHQRGGRNVVINKGGIVFDNVRFGYHPRQATLKGISFSIPGGAKVALVGPNGGGKSTILRLLFRFYDPDAGTIYIDEHDLKCARQRSIREQIGVVPQDIVIFNESVFYNISYGNRRASEDAVFRAAKAAQIHQTIVQYPDAYETKLGKGGFHLSQSEKQRIAIARALLKDPAIVLMEEATDSLDRSLDHELQQAFSALMEGRTTVMVARQLSSIINADTIFVIQDGQVVESGTHDSLMEPLPDRRGLYYDMWQTQCMGEEQSYKSKGTLVADGASYSVKVPSDIAPYVDTTQQARKPGSRSDNECMPTMSVEKEKDNVQRHDKTER